MSIKTVDALTLKTWVDNNEAQIVDIREIHEHQTRHISGSILISSNTITAKDLQPYPAKKYIFHCNSGGRGGRTCAKLQEEDATLDLYNLEGGLKAWIAAGLPVVEDETSTPEAEGQFCMTRKP